MGNERAILLEHEPRVHRITVEEFLALDGAGFVREVGCVELADGEIFEIAPRHVPHSRAQMQLGIAIGLAVDAVDGWEALSPVSAELDRYNLPEVDNVIATVVVDGSDKSLLPRRSGSSSRLRPARYATTSATSSVSMLAPASPNVGSST